MNNLQDMARQLRLKWIPENLDHELAESARHQRTSQQTLERLFAGEIEAQKQRIAENNLRKARIPFVKTLESFDFSWPKWVNKDLVRHLFSLKFLDAASNVVFIGTVGAGKTHLATALACEVCNCGKKALFTTTVAMIQALETAQTLGTLKREMRLYTTPALLVLDELGYLPIDSRGANLLFQVISSRYERASTIITTNRAFKDWAPCFNDDPTVTSAVLDRVCHHCEVIEIDAISYRMRDNLPLQK